MMIATENSTPSRVLIRVSCACHCKTSLDVASLGFGHSSPAEFNPERYLDLPRLASDYAGAADYND